MDINSLLSRLKAMKLFAFDIQKKTVLYKTA